MDTAVDDGRLAAAREAAGRHAWTEAYELLDALDRERKLGGAGLELLGSVAWWAAQPDISVGARERAFAAYLEEGDQLRAAYMALLASHEILAIRGEWESAEEEASRASNELLSFKAYFQAAEGYYALAEIRLRMGDLSGADEALRQAQDLGRDPQPARALLYLAQGRTDAAALSIDRTLAVGGERLWRARLLPAQVEIAITAGALDVARGAAQELVGIAEDYGSPALRAAAHYANASVRVAEQDGRSALEELARARTQWQTVEAPYELARVRGCTAIALRLLGETHEAELELESARATFLRLGANLDVGRCDRVIEELRRRTEQGERQQRTFMFTDIVGSTELLAVIGDEAWNDLKRWHDQTLRSLVAKHEGEEVNEAGDGFFFAFEGVSMAVDAAMAIQRALAEHRRSAGFAPRVRIGLHAAEATKVQDSYVGQAVHQAARIGSVAGANEIVASVGTVAGYTGAALGAPRAVELKGIPQPVEVCTIEWAPDR